VIGPAVLGKEQQAPREARVLAFLHMILDEPFIKDSRLSDPFR
jgi:hypothetical protein